MTYTEKQLKRAESVSIKFASWLGYGRVDTLAHEIATALAEERAEGVAEGMKRAADKAQLWASNISIFKEVDCELLLKKLETDILSEAGEDK